MYESNERECRDLYRIWVRLCLSVIDGNHGRGGGPGGRGSTQLCLERFKTRRSFDDAKKAPGRRAEAMRETGVLMPAALPAGEADVWCSLSRTEITIATTKPDIGLGEELDGWRADASASISLPLEGAISWERVESLRLAGTSYERCKSWPICAHLPQGQVFAGAGSTQEVKSLYFGVNLKAYHYAVRRCIGVASCFGHTRTSEHFDAGRCLKFRCCARA